MISDYLSSFDFENYGENTPFDTFNKEFGTVFWNNHYFIDRQIDSSSELHFETVIKNEDHESSPEDNHYQKSNQDNDYDIQNKKTKEETKETNFLNKKRESSSDDENKKSKQGRKKKEVTDKGDHTKYKGDNIMRKIKSNFLLFVHNKTNDAIKNKNYQFLKLNPSLNENLKKDFNMELMDRTFKDLYEKEKIGEKYSKNPNKEKNQNNKKVIKYLYQNPDEETEAIKITNKTYIEFFNESKEEFSRELFNKIWEQEKKKGEKDEDINAYIKDINNIIDNYREWFDGKKGRKGRSKNEIEKEKNIEMIEQSNNNCFIDLSLN